MNDNTMVTISAFINKHGALFTRFGTSGLGRGRSAGCAASGPYKAEHLIQILIKSASVPSSKNVAVSTIRPLVSITRRCTRRAHAGALSTPPAARG
ncbi:hypothetical protein EVAR_20028_1 [Eumeta japonica]|uniref:Uncharacterized protein n=1 Tax=Eumeta variegata TaxID=151549 RepID=A0A4C1V9I4_EUMVA|nr:hypothetical protein EVAR_20028_1 [Eumeta japonica]